MKYHKIRSIPLDVCTVEQKLAYNLAFNIYTNEGAEFDKVQAACPGNAAADAVRLANKYVRIYKDKFAAYDIDAIFSALNAGLYAYLTGQQHIFASYKDIGQAFPANYLKA